MLPTSQKQQVYNNISPQAQIQKTYSDDNLL